MKMADGGFRPAYNMQIIAEPTTELIVAVDVDTSGRIAAWRDRRSSLAARGYKPSTIDRRRLHQK